MLGQARVKNNRWCGNIYICTKIFAFDHLPNHTIIKPYNDGCFFSICSMQDSKNTPRLSHNIFLLLWPHKHAKSLAHLCVWFLKTGELIFIRAPYANNHVTQNKFIFKGFPNRQSNIIISCKNIASLYRHISRNQSIKWHHVCIWTPSLSVFCRQKTQCWQQRWA